jgi:hypothetical protein
MTSPADSVAALTAQVWAQATRLSGVVDDKVNEALSLASTAPSIAAPDLIYAPALPSTPALPTMSQAEATGLFDSTKTDILNMLVGEFTTFIGTYFANDAYLTDAEDWLHQALAVGGTGINPTVEAQLWERVRSKALTDAARAQDELSVTWAARRFPVPPGAYMNAGLVLARDSMDATAEAARSQAIESFKVEVENTRIAIERAIALRGVAMQTASEYVRTLATGPQVAASAAGTIIDAEARFASTMTDYYRAQLTAVDIPVRIATTNSTLKVQTNEANLRTAMETLSARVSAVISQAQMLASQAAAAFNSIHTQASISGSDSTNTNIQG